MHLLYFVYQAGYFNLLKMHFRFTGFYTGQVQNIIDQLQQQITILLNNLQVFMFLLFIFRYSHNLRKSHNSIQRSANLVTHIRQKYRLHPVSILCTTLSFYQFLGTANTITDIVYQRQHSVTFKRSNACLKIMFTSIYFQWILYFFQLTVLQTFPNVTEKQITYFRRINTSSVRSFQYFYRM